jgi:hypothetical protein
MWSRFTRIVRLPVVLAAALAPLAALAQPPADAPERRAQMAQQMAEHFKAADKDGDGALTRAEAEAGLPRLAKRFDDIDTAAPCPPPAVPAWPAAWGCCWPARPVRPSSAPSCRPPR